MVSWSSRNVMVWKYNWKLYLLSLGHPGLANKYPYFYCLKLKCRWEKYESHIKYNNGHILSIWRQNFGRIIFIEYQICGCMIHIFKYIIHICIYICIIKRLLIFSFNYDQPCTAYSSYTLKSPYKLRTNFFDSVDKGKHFQ